MKTYKISFLMIILSLVMLIPAGAQDLIVEKYDDTYCTTSSCNVYFRQYTGVVNRWRLTLQCLDGNGNWQQKVYYGDGLYCGTFCGGVDPVSGSC